MAISLSGSLEITGSINATGGITGSFSGTATSASYALIATSASYAANATSASYALIATSASYATNSDLLDGRDSLTFANTGSNAFVGTQNINGAVAITGSLTTTGAITAQTLNVQQVTSSIVYSSGSNIFGNSVSNTQSMTGSVGISGSLAVTGASTITGVLTLNSTITNGTYTYTLPSATGTLALTSAIPANPVGGTGTTNTLPKFTGASTIGNSIVNDNGTGIGIGIAAASPFILNTLSTDATTSGVIGIMQIGRASSGTAANGIGGNLQFTAQDTAGNQRTAAYITWKLAVASSASPQGYLSIGSRNASEALIIADSGAATFSSSVTATQLNATTTTAGFAAILTNTNGASDSNGLLVKAGSVSSEYNVRFANQTDTTTFFTVKGNGNVGIGTTSPLNIFDVKGAIFTGSYATSAGVRFHDNVYGINLGGIDASSIGIIQGSAFEVGAANIALQPNGGNVGIGTTSPVSKLTVFTPTTQSNAGVWSNCEIAMHNSTSVGDYSQIGLGYTTGTTNAAAFIGFISTSATANGKGSLVFGTRDVTTDTAPTTRLTIASTGTSTFTTTENTGGVYVTSATDNTTIRVASTETGGQEWRLQSTGGTSGLGQGKLIFKVGGTETGFNIPLTLTTDNSTNGGRVGIGTTSPSVKFEVQSSASNSFFRNSSTTPTTTYITVVNANNSSNGLVMAHISDGTGYFGTQNSADLRLVTGDVEKMRITSAGNVGIGTTSPSAIASALVLNIYAASGIRSSLVVESNAGANFAVLGSGLSGGDLGVFYYNLGMRFGSATSKDATGFSEAMRITSGGNVLIGTTTDSGYKFQVEGQIYNQGNSATSLIIARNYSSGSITIQQFIQNGVGTIGSISFNGTNVLYNATSDYRLKHDFRDYNALSIISSIKTYDFEWKSNKTRSYGVIAHELAEIMPSIVSGEKDEIDENGKVLPQAVDYSKLVPIMIKAIQEQQSQIEALKLLIK